MADNEKKAKNIDIPEAGVSQELDNFELWVVEHRKKILVVSAILVVVIATGICLWRWHKGAENRSREAFAKAVTAEQIEAALKKHPKGPAASGVRLRLAEKYNAKKEYAKAAAVLSEVVKDQTADLYVRSRAEVNAGRYYELAKNVAEAEKAYASAANNAAYQEPVRAEAAYLLGCLYVAKNDTAKAQASFKRAMVAKPTYQATVVWSQLAARAMDRLSAGK